MTRPPKYNHNIRLALTLDIAISSGINILAAKVIEAILPTIAPVIESNFVSPIIGGTYKLATATGEVKYVGHTNNFSRRRIEHFQDSIKGTLNFIIDRFIGDKTLARGREQVLINHHQPILNKINSVSPKNSMYDFLLNFGQSLGSP